VPILKRLASRLSSDLTDVRLMYLKAGLFALAGVAASAAIVAQNPDLTTVFLLAVSIWSFCRLYYFFFYVIEKYIDPSYRFAGLSSAVRFLLAARSGTRSHVDADAE